MICKNICWGFFCNLPERYTPSHQDFASNKCYCLHWSGNPIALSADADIPSDREEMKQSHTPSQEEKYWINYCLSHFCFE